MICLRKVHHKVWRTTDSGKVFVVLGIHTRRNVGWMSAGYIGTYRKLNDYAVSARGGLFQFFLKVWAAFGYLPSQID